jgi:polar amino acid transport system substrate-binding protein
MSYTKQRSTSNIARRAMLALGLASVAGSGPILWAAPAHADALTAVKKRGFLRAGVQEAQVPQGYIDGHGHLVGIDIDITKGFAKQLGVTVDFMPVTPSNRIPSLLTGKIDLIAAGMGIYPARMKVVLFSRPYYNVDTVFLAKAGNHLKGFADLRGLRVGVPRGTPQDIAITNAQSGAIIRRFDDDASTVQALISGQVDVIGAASTQLANIDRVVGKGEFVTAFTLNRQFNAFAVRPGEIALVDAMNAYLAAADSDGTLAALYTRWTGDKLANLPSTAASGLPITFIRTP